MITSPIVRNAVPLVMLAVMAGVVLMVVVGVVLLALKKPGTKLAVPLGAFGGELGQAKIVQAGPASGLGDMMMIVADVFASNGGPPMRVTANVRVPMLSQAMVIPGATIPCRYQPGNTAWLDLNTGPSF